MFRDRSPIHCLRPDRRADAHHPGPRRQGRAALAARRDGGGAPRPRASRTPRSRFEGEGHGYRKAESRRRVYAAELVVPRPGVRVHARGRRSSRSWSSTWRRAEARGASDAQARRRAAPDAGARPRTRAYAGQRSAARPRRGHVGDDVVSGDSPKRTTSGSRKSVITPRSIRAAGERARVRVADRDVRAAPRRSRGLPSVQPSGARSASSRSHRVGRERRGLRADRVDPGLGHDPDALLDRGQREDRRRAGQPAARCPVRGRTPGPWRTGRAARTSPGSAAGAGPAAAARRTGRRARRGRRTGTCRCSRRRGRRRGRRGSTGIGAAGVRQVPQNVGAGRARRGLDRIDVDDRRRAIADQRQEHQRDVRRPAPRSRLRPPGPRPGRRRATGSRARAPPRAPRGRSGRSGTRARSATITRRSGRSSSAADATRYRLTVVESRDRRRTRAPPRGPRPPAVADPQRQVDPVVPGRGRARRPTRPRPRRATRSTARLGGRPSELPSR